MKRPVICGDWGASRLRLFVVGDPEQDRNAPELRFGQGIGRLLGQAQEAELFKTSGDWLDRYPDAPFLLAGTVGSNLGLFDAGYLPCPTTLDHLSDHISTRMIGGRSVSIVPGIRCTNDLGRPDRIRSEETQLLGWMATEEVEDNEHFICLPGTHTKWVHMRGARVDRFTSAMTGEVYHLLVEGSIIAAGEAADFDLAAFDAGAEMAKAAGREHLLNLLFSIRAHQLNGDFSAADARSHLSGLLVASDVGATFAMTTVPDTVTVIGDKALASLYVRLIERRGRKARLVDGEPAAIAGLSAIARTLDV